MQIKLYFFKDKSSNEQTDVAAGTICVLTDVTEIFMSPWKSPSSIFHQANLIIHCISEKAK